MVSSRSCEKMLEFFFVVLIWCKFWWSVVVVVVVVVSGGITITLSSSHKPRTLRDVGVVFFGDFVVVDFVRVVVVVLAALAAIGEGDVDFLSEDRNDDGVWMDVIGSKMRLGGGGADEGVGIRKGGDRVVLGGCKRFNLVVVVEVEVASRMASSAISSGTSDSSSSSS